MRLRSRVAAVYRGTTCRMQSRSCSWQLDSGQGLGGNSGLRFRRRADREGVNVFSGLTVAEIWVVALSGGSTCMSDVPDSCGM